MLTIFLNWIYIGITAFCLGCGFSAFSGRVFGYRLKRMDSVLMAGLIIATVYAQIFSLFGGVGLLANIILILGCAGIAVLCREEMKAFIAERWNGFSGCSKLLTVILVIVWAFYSSRGYCHYDTDLYHAQSIRWIEEYGVVPGLGNLHLRFGYNSSLFALSALYSMKFLFGQSMHTVSGFFALLLSITALDITKSWKRRKFIVSDYARVGLIYYLTTIIEYVLSPASDYVIMCMTFFIVIKWLDCLEQGEKDIAPYALLCVVGVYAMTLKLTAGLILLLVIKPACELLKKKHWKEIGIYIGMGLTVAIPWFVRTVIISGWLIYPFSALDLFDVDWKIPKWLVEVDATDIYAFGKATYNEVPLDVSVVDWLPNWFQTTLAGMEKLLILGCAGSVLICLVRTLWIFVKRKWHRLDDMLVMGTVVCCYLFWQFSAPLIRYGYAYVLLLVFLTAGWLVSCIGLHKLVYYFMICYGIYKACALMPYTKQIFFFKENYIWQQEYGVYKMDSYDVNGETFYYSTEGDRAGYEYFPATVGKVDFEFRGDSIEDGFRLKEQKEE